MPGTRGSSDAQGAARLSWPSTLAPRLPARRLGGVGGTPRFRFLRPRGGGQAPTEKLPPHPPRLPTSGVKKRRNPRNAATLAACAGSAQAVQMVLRKKEIGPGLNRLLHGPRPGRAGQAPAAGAAIGAACSTAQPEKTERSACSQRTPWSTPFLVPLDLGRLSAALLAAPTPTRPNTSCKPPSATPFRKAGSSHRRRLRRGRRGRRDAAGGGHIGVGDRDCVHVEGERQPSRLTVQASMVERTSLGRKLTFLQ